jgi:hypothetical protein
MEQELKDQQFPNEDRIYNQIRLELGTVHQGDTSSFLRYGILSSQKLKHNCIGLGGKNG